MSGVNQFLPNLPAGRLLSVQRLAGVRLSLAGVMRKSNGRPVKNRPGSHR